MPFKLETKTLFVVRATVRGVSQIISVIMVRIFVHLCDKIPINIKAEEGKAISLMYLLTLTILRILFLLSISQ